MKQRIVLGWMLLVCLLAHSTIARSEEKRAARTPVDLDASRLDAIVGRYQLDPGHALAITRFRDRLVAQSADDPPFVILPESETVFFHVGSSTRISFLEDKQGKVTAARYEHGKVNLAGPKVSDMAYEVADAPEILDSPRLAALVKEIEAGSKTAALAKFWKEVQDHAPLVEPLVGNAGIGHMSWVTFLSHGDAKTRAVSMFGGPLADSGDGRGVNFMRLRDTDVWYRTVRMPNDARFVYAYEINLSCRLPDDPDALRKLCRTNDCPDVLNAKFIDTAGANLAVYSLLEMPEAPPQPYIHANPGIPAGKLTHHKIKSDILNQARTYSVYTPPGSGQNGDARAQGASVRYPLVVLFDGGQYSSDMMIPGPIIVDNLIASKKIPPVVVAFVDQVDRAKDLNCSKEFAAFVATELVPRVRSEQHAGSEARGTTVGGSSLGGVMAAYCALEYPAVFGNVISQSGAYWVYPGALDGRPLVERRGGTLIDEFVKRPKLHVRFYLEAGTFEDDLPCSLLAENRRFRDVLRAKGYEVVYSEFAGGHHFINWRGTFSDALIAVTR